MKNVEKSSSHFLLFDIDFLVYSANLIQKTHLLKRILSTDADSMFRIYDSPYTCDQLELKRTEREEKTNEITSSKDVGHLNFTLGKLPKHGIKLKLCTRTRP